MTGRARVLKAFRHEEPDRTPIFERLIKPPTDAVVLGRESATSFLERLRTWEAEGWEALMERQAQDMVEMVKRLGFDMIRLGMNAPKTSERPRRIGAYAWRVGDTIQHYLPETGVVRSAPVSPERIDEEEQERRMIAEVGQEYIPPDLSEDRFRVFRRAKEMMAEAGMDPAIYVSNYAVGTLLPRFCLEWFYWAPELIHRYYEKCSRAAIDRGRKFVEMGATVIGLGGDFAGNRGPMISPAHYERFIEPRIREQADALHREGVFVTNTSDGNLWPVIGPFLIGTRVDGYGEIDGIAGMDLGVLKERYGDRICFLGNLDIKRVLCSGTVEDSKRMMIECIEKGWGNGGHVIMTSNVVHQDVKPENYLAALDAYWDYFGCSDRVKRET